MLLGSDIASSVEQIAQNKLLGHLLLRRVDPYELPHSGQGSMIINSTEQICLHLNISCAEDIVNSRLNLVTLYHPTRQWRTQTIHLI